MTISRCRDSEIPATTKTKRETFRGVASHGIVMTQLTQLSRTRKEGEREGKDRNGAGDFVWVRLSLGLYHLLAGHS